MASTTLFNFSVSSQVFLNPVDWKTVQQGMRDIFLDSGFDGCPHTVSFGANNGSLILYSGPDGRSAVVQSYAEGLITVNMQEPSKQEHLLMAEQLCTLEKRLATLLGCEKSKRFPRIQRSISPCDPYIPTVDNRLVEYDFDRIVFEEDSKYQNIKIQHSPQYGNMLILDNDPNLAESDIAYTKAITGNGRQDYRGKEILVLGGGDGGILHVLRQEDPAMIVMIEIDEVVINAATKHLRGICFDSMDELEGSNYKVIVEDCVPVLKQYATEGKQFDYVINDLTAIPITTEPQGDQWDFLRLILDLSMKVLKPTGRYFTQGNGANMRDALAMYEQQLGKLSFKVEFSKETVCVPSYMEMWVFYEVWKQQGQNGS
ncbi:spermine synthase-like [Acanthaster planci]|uniref:Spermine synthase-like n=1 Tax=Acanthaster planci TaxID=133434 RepID=A0A8B7Z621_ACAPL|nr:spermine synthase-like [Acanthaster planci]